MIKSALLAAQTIPSVTIQPPSLNIQSPPEIFSALMYHFSVRTTVQNTPLMREVGWQMYPKSHGMAEKNMQKTVPHVARLKLNFCKQAKKQNKNKPPFTALPLLLCRKQAVSSFLQPNMIVRILIFDNSFHWIGPYQCDALLSSRRSPRLDFAETKNTNYTMRHNFL